MRDTVTTILDVIGLLAVASGTGLLAAAGFAALWGRPAVGVAMVGVGALVAGVVLTVGSVLSVLAATRRAATAVGDTR